MSVRRAGGIAITAAVLLAHSSGPAAAGSTPEVAVAMHSGTFEVRGKFTARAPLAAAWEVLTDYAKIASYVSSIRESVVARRNGDSLLVRQVATIGVFPFKKTARVSLAVHEEPRHHIEFVDVSGENFRKYAGTWTLRADSGSTVVDYSLDASPRSGLPGWIARGAMRSTISDMLAEVQREIERRATRR